MITINIETAKHALATLDREKQAQKDRLKLAAEAKQRFKKGTSVNLTQISFGIF